MNEVDFNKRISSRIKAVREHCLEWDIDTTAKVLGITPKEVFEFEENMEPCSCSYFLTLCDYSGVCPDSLIHLPDKENPQELMRWSFDHYIFKLGYTGIDKDNEFKNFKEPNTLEILNYKDFRSIEKSQRV